MKALLQKLWPWLHRCCSENNGMPSSSRVLMFGWHGLVAVVWLVDSAVHHRMAGIEGTVLAFLGMVSGAKVINKFGEPNGPPPVVS